MDPSGGKERSNRYLGRYHFEQVLRFIQGYDQYRQNLFERTDSELAGSREERLDPAHGEAIGRREDRRGERHRAPRYSRYSSSLSATPSYNRGTPDRQFEPEHRRYGSRTPTRGIRRERPPSPAHPCIEGPSQRPVSSREHSDQEYEDYSLFRR